MSAEAVGWVWRWAPYRESPTAMVVHLAIADVVNDTHGNQFWMSNATLAEKVGMTRESVNRILRRMVDDGHLRVVYAEHGKTVIYEMVMKEPVTQDHTSDDGGVTQDHRGCDPSVTGGVIQASHKTNRTQEEPKLTLISPDGEREDLSTKSRSDRLAELFDEFWAAYPRKVGKVTARAAFAKACKGERDLEGFTDDMAAGLKRWLRYWRREKVDLTYIPHASSWLNQRRWEEHPAATNEQNG